MQLRIAYGEWLTTGQVAMALGCSSSSVRRLVASGELPARRLRHWVGADRTGEPQWRRIHIADLEAYLARCNVKKILRRK